jgi:dTMP kinase
VALTATLPRSTLLDEERSGLFITLEGGEGAGKSVQAEALACRLEGFGLAVVRTREPGGTPLGERLREILLDLSSGGTSPPLDPLTETLVFVAARAELVASIIAPALARDDAVVCDRFADSTLAYQGYGRGVELAAIDQLNDIATQGLRPDLTVLLDLPVEEGLARTRMAGQADRFGREDESFHERVRAGYLALAAEEPERWLVVDAVEPLDMVTEAIWRRVEALLERR